MEYILIKKRVKNITLRLDKNGDVKISAPIWVHDELIEKFLDSKREWIISRQNIIKNSLPKYISGEKILFFENEYILNIIEHNKYRVEINDNILNIYTRDISNTSKIEKLINSYFVKLSDGFMNKSISKYSSVINRNIKSIKFRNMTSRWGSCNTKNATITLNTLLFRKPYICFEYVLLHEMVHLVHPNHSKDFYNLLESLMPNWYKVKMILES